MRTSGRRPTRTMAGGTAWKEAAGTTARDARCSWGSAGRPAWLRPLTWPRCRPVASATPVEGEAAVQDYLPFIIIGLFTGAVYALAAAGLVLTYKTSGVFNFAHGAVGMFAAFLFFHLRAEWGWPTWAAVA